MSPLDPKSGDMPASQAVVPERVTQGARRAPMPLRELFSHHGKDMLRVVFLDVVVAVGFFLVCIYVMTYVQNFGGMTYRFALMTNTLSMVIFAAAIPLAGILADRWGFIGVMQRFILILGLLAVPCFWALSSGIPGMIVLGHGLLSLVMGCVFAPVPALMVSIFPAHVRYSGVSLAHNISMAVFGGSAPQVATYLIQGTHLVWAPGVFLALAALVSWLSLENLKRSRKSFP